MRNLICLIFVALFSVAAFGKITGDNEYKLNTFSASGAQNVQLGTLLTQTSNLLVARYSFAVQGGASTASISLLTDLSNTRSYAVLPNKAIIKNVWVDVLTQPTSSGSASVSVKAVSTGDLLTATAKGSITGFVQGTPNNTTTNAIKLTASKTIKADVTINALTAGKFDVYIEYVLGN